MLRIAFRTVLFIACLSAAITIAGQTDTCKPSIETSSLLNNIDVYGPISIGKLWGRCLPMPTKASKTAYEYNPYDGGKLSADLKNSAGKTLNTFVFYGNNIQSIWELDRYEIVGGPTALKKLEPGKYTLEFAIEDKPFQTFPFSFTTRQSSDQFRPETMYFLDGAWSDHAQLYAPNVDRFFQLIVWLRNDAATDTKPTPTPFRVQLIRESDRKTLAEYSEGQLLLKNSWQVFKLSFRRLKTAETKEYSEFKLSEIASADGRYRIELTLADKPYASYYLNVKNGQINNTDLTKMRKDLYRIMLPLTAQRKK